MFSGQPTRFPLRGLMLVGILALAPWHSVRADTLYTIAGSGAAMEMSGVTVLDVREGSLHFRSAGGAETDRTIETITRIDVTDEPVLSAAEKAFAEKNWTAAAEGYLKAAKTTKAPWVRRWSGQRLLKVAAETGRIDVAITGYVAVAMTEPTAAAELRPTINRASKTALDAAAAEIRTALSDRDLPVEPRRALLSLMMDVQRARGDRRAAADAIEQIMALGPLDPADPQSAGLLIRLKLDQAAIATEDKQYQRAIDEIRAAQGLFTEPGDQADALLALGDAQLGLAQQTKSPVGLKDAALTYMRIVAHFEDLPQAPHVADALLRTAKIHEALGEPQTALALYGQIEREYAQSPAAAAARTAADRLRSASPAQPTATSQERG
jgi:TolA-binding protein